LTLSRLSNVPGRLTALAPLAALACSLVMSGCAAYRPRHIDARRSLAAFEARRLDAPGLRRYLERASHRPVAAWPLPSWDFEQLTLVADYYNADLAAARARLAVARAAVISAGARPNPTLAFSPAYDTTAEPGISPWTLGFTLDIPIETAGKRGYRIAEAQQLANAASCRGSSSLGIWRRACWHIG
jgi:cobalt-zinc-cadmium efflux system outer membrane protein